MLRLWLGLRALLSSLEKYAGTEIVEEPLLDEFRGPRHQWCGGRGEDQGLWQRSTITYRPTARYKFAAEPLIPGGLSLYDSVLGYPGALRVALLISLAPRVTLFLHGLLYCSLSVGLILLNESMRWRVSLVRHTSS